jgi:hypothetical protein
MMSLVERNWTMRYITAIVIVATVPLLAAEPFNGTNLDGWKFKSHPTRKSHWTVGAASLNSEDPRTFAVESTGSQLINNVTGHGQGVDIYSEATFGDCIIELEVMVPRGSNSGIYVMGEYEIQVLDSFGKDRNPGPGDMGAIYGAAPPKNPLYRKPGEWSTFEIHFRAPRFDADGRKTDNARFVKVILNGRTIHEDVEMKGPTPAGVTGRESSRGPLMFQGDHGPVSFRKIRIRPLEP